VSLVCSCKFLCRFYTVNSHSLPPSLPSFDVIAEMGREGSMARRAERRLSERARRYRASGGAGRVSFVLFQIFVQIFYG